MPRRPVLGSPFDAELEAGFATVRRELDVPQHFPPAVIDAAEQVARVGPTLPPGVPDDVVDRTDLNLVTIDPPASIDLDQAFAAETTTAGFRVWYAIADVSAFVGPGSLLDIEARERGVTLYSPDQRASLHPEAINEQAGSLLPGTDKPAVLWQIDLDKEGNQTNASARRATVRSRSKLTYAEAQQHIDAGTGDQSLSLLRTVGLLREQLEAARGAISLRLPSQEITRTDNGYSLHYDTSLPVEGWNAQISLLTGMAAAQIMVDVGHGLLRTLPTLDDHTVNQVRRAARALEIEWPTSESYPDRVRRLDPNIAAEAALLTRAARSFRGAGYEAFANHALPEQPLHGAIASIYAHVTAPLRRVCDRFSNEIVLAACADRPAPAWALEALDELPELMGQARRRDGALDRAMVDFVETMTMRDRVGEVFSGVVLSHGRSGANVQLRDPAVLTRIGSQPEIGTEVSLRLDSVDINSRRMQLSVLA